MRMDELVSGMCVVREEIKKTLALSSQLCEVREIKHIIKYKGVREE